MAEIIDLEQFKRQNLASRVMKPWSKRFPEKLDENTRFSDLTNRTLGYLIQPGEESAFATYELILAMKDLGGVARFFFMEEKEKMSVIELGIFLLDQFRFECLKRLGWIVSFPSAKYPILELIHNYNNLAEKIRNENPVLAPHHPDYHEFEQATELDKEAIVRRLIPAALKVFPEMMEKNNIPEK